MELINIINNSWEFDARRKYTKEIRHYVLTPRSSSIKGKICYDLTWRALSESDDRLINAYELVILCQKIFEHSEFDASFIHLDFKYPDGSMSDIILEKTPDNKVTDYIESTLIQISLFCIKT